MHLRRPSSLLIHELTEGQKLSIKMLKKERKRSRSRERRSRSRDRRRSRSRDKERRRYWTWMIACIDWMEYIL